MSAFLFQKQNDEDMSINWFTDFDKMKFSNQTKFSFFIIKFKGIESLVIGVLNLCSKYIYLILSHILKINFTLEIFLIKIITLMQ